MKVLFAAIDIGTSYSGLAFATIHELGQSPPKISTKCWHPGSSLVSDKTPTCVLIKPDGKTLEAFGYDAENRYLELEEEDMHRDYYYFRHFKSALNTAFQTSKKTKINTLQDVNGRRLPALVVVSVTLGFMVGSVLEEFNKSVRGTDFTVADVEWVITVPDTWTDTGKQFMVEAAKKIGILPGDLSIVLESEAAFVFCRFTHESKSEKPSETTLFEPEKLYMVLDVGGETAKVTVYEMTSTGPEQIVAESRADIGGVSVDTAAENLLEDLVGKKAFKSFKKDHRSEYLDLCRDIESKKRSFREDHVVRLKVPRQIQLDEMTNKKSKYSEKIEFRRDKIEMKHPLFKGLFDKGIEGVLKLIRNVMKKRQKALQMISAIMMTGGFSESTLLQEAITSTFAQNIVIIKPPEAGLSVLKGAIFTCRIPQNIQATGNVIVGAIDFGTMYSGWAFSTTADFMQDPTNVSTMSWNSGEELSKKAPSCVLIRPDGQTLEAFGYDAEDRYQQLAEDDKHRDYYFFRCFKMELNKFLQDSKVLKRSMTLEDITGKVLPALLVFSLSIEYLISSLLEHFNRGFKGKITVNNIEWVLTVPAIWTDASKQFMREAAIKAKIPSKKLTIALEPEAASLYCRHSPVKVSDETNIAKFDPGEKYMVLDAGGGTVDITVHEITATGGIKEIMAASGGGWGGTLVNEAFEDLLANFFGENEFLAFRKQDTEDYLELGRRFEVKKRKISSKDKNNVTISVHQSLVSRLNARKGEKIASMGKKSY